MTRNAHRGFVILFLLLTVFSGCTHRASKPSNEQQADQLRQCAEEAYRNDNLARSERCYQRLSEAVSYTAADWYRLGNIYARTQRPSAAVSAYREAVNLDPSMADAWYNLGIVQLQGAVKSFLALQEHANADNPRHANSSRMIKGILQLIDNTAAETR